MAAAQPPHEALDVEALGASVATHVTDACQVLVEQAAATGVEAALAKGRSADHKSALAKAEKAQGNTQRALDQALNLAAKRGERWSVIFYSAGGVLHCTPVWRQQLLSMGFRVPNASSNPSS